MDYTAHIGELYMHCHAPHLFILLSADSHKGCVQVRNVRLGKNFDIPFEQFYRRTISITHSQENT